MLNPLRKFFRFSAPAPSPAIPPEERIYAIGDIHGRLDLFSALARAIEQDDQQAGRARTTIILLGDLIDRGPDSAGVIALARQWRDRRRVRILMGNHEEMFLDSFQKTATLRQFLRHGGEETILSYGVDRDTYNQASLEELQQMMFQAVPREDLAFVGSFEDRIVAGDYMFVHAGILPEAPPEQQKRQDLRWIREPFLSFEGRHSHVIVHGHTICEEVTERPNRIGLDTGAYIHGRLTALVLEGTSRRFLTANETDGRITVEGRRTELA